MRCSRALFWPPWHPGLLVFGCVTPLPCNQATRGRIHHALPSGQSTWLAIISGPGRGGLQRARHGRGCAEFGNPDPPRAHRKRATAAGAGVLPGACGRQCCNFRPQEGKTRLGGLGELRCCVELSWDVDGGDSVPFGGKWASAGPVRHAQAPGVQTAGRAGRRREGARQLQSMCSRMYKTSMSDGMTTLIGILLSTLTLIFNATL